MSKSSEKLSPLEKIAAFIVDRRKGFYLIYILLIIFSLFSTNWVSVNNELTDYLSEETETRQGLSLMENEFVTYATAEIMIDNISYADAEVLCNELKAINGIKDIAFDSTDNHYVNASALFSVTFEGTSSDDITVTAFNEIENRLDDYDTYISASIGDADSKRMANEMNMVMLIACVIILAVLLISSHTYMEIPVLVITFGVAAILNKGTNFMLGTISFISNSIAVVLQLALAIDYAIILCHRYTEERESKEPREAVITALCKAIPEISGSCLTTLSGLAAMGFMQFKIGFDMSIVLIKAIIISILSVFTLMPGLLMSFSKLIDKTHHKNFVPQITAWSNGVIKARFVTPCIFAVLIVICFFLSNNCPYAYSDTDLDTIKKNETQIAREMINDTFSRTNVLAVIVPSGDYEKEQALKSKLEKYSQVDSVTGLASVEAIDGYAVGDKLSPREFSELTDMDIEVVRLLYSSYAAKGENYGKIVGGIDNYKIALLDMFDFVFEMIDEGYVSLDDEMQKDLDELHNQLTDGKKQLGSENYSRLVMNLNIPEEGEETFEFLSTVRETAKRFYGDDVILVGNATSNYDLSVAFVRDNLIITILSIVFVLIVLFFTFQSAGIPLILILVIQGSIWLNFSFPTLQDKPIFFMSYLVVSSIQMGANIDYAIVITNRYTELRREMNKFEAIKQSLDLAFPTIFTSGTILACAGFAIGLFSSNPVISSVGSALGRGTVISIILVMGILPQLLVLGDFIIEKTSFSLKDIKEHIKIGGGTDEE
ncbi:MAG: MMPL family transporter [Clostridiales bacterium]|nr:MMPL family transporter [Clostridiales bacterium]